MDRNRIYEIHKTRYNITKHRSTPLAILRFPTYHHHRHFIEHIYFFITKMQTKYYPYQAKTSGYPLSALFLLSMAACPPSMDRLLQIETYYSMFHTFALRYPYIWYRYKGCIKFSTTPIVELLSSNTDPPRLFLTGIIWIAKSRLICFLLTYFKKVVCIFPTFIFIHHHRYYSTDSFLTHNFILILV